MLIIRTGKSGSGKSAILKELVSADLCECIITATTRPIRVGEVNGRDYCFLSEKEYIQNVAEENFIETYDYTATTGTIYHYGSFKKVLDRGKDYVIILDPQGINFCGILWQGKMLCS